jgi:hypothetical protein
MNDINYNTNNEEEKIEIIITSLLNDRHWILSRVRYQKQQYREKRRLNHSNNR